MSTNLLEQEQKLEIKIAETEEDLSRLCKENESLEEYKKSSKVRP